MAVRRGLHSLHGFVYSSLLLGYPKVFLPLPHLFSSPLIVAQHPLVHHLYTLINQHYGSDMFDASALHALSVVASERRIRHLW